MRNCLWSWSAICPSLLQRGQGHLAAVVARCCEIKAEMVGQDETENGLRAILNFGHTIGHAIENSSGYGNSCTARQSPSGRWRQPGFRTNLGLPAGEVARIENLFVRAGLPVEIKLNAARGAKSCLPR